MLMSQLLGKEIVDLSEGIRLGPVREADLVVSARGGRIEALVLPMRQGWWSRREVVIPWNRILKVGPDVIIVDLGDRAAPGIPTLWRERLRVATGSLVDRRESADDGNGHWSVQQPR